MAKLIALFLYQDAAHVNHPSTIYAHVLLQSRKQTPS
jgi:hypothetical protein